MLQFDKPNYKIIETIPNSFYGKFELEPLERGFGTTLGNALRRVMLSSLPGSAMTCVKIDGVLHEFQTIEGVYEDVTTIILNLKSVVFKNYSNGPKTVRIDVDEEKDVTAADITTDSDIEVINKDQFIAKVVKGGKLHMEITVNNGRGYVTSEENKKLYNLTHNGEIATDSSYSPIERVSPEVEKTRVGQDENYDKLILEVWTNGAIEPQEAISIAAQILIEHFKIVTEVEPLKEITPIMVEKEEDPKQKALETPIEDLDFSVRAYNCLKREGVSTLQDLVNMSASEVSKIHNLGKKSLDEVLLKIKELGLVLKEED